MNYRWKKTCMSPRLTPCPPSANTEWEVCVKITEVQGLPQGRGVGGNKVQPVPRMCVLVPVAMVTRLLKDNQK